MPVELARRRRATRADATTHVGTRARHGRATGSSRVPSGLSTSLACHRSSQMSKPERRPPSVDARRRRARLEVAVLVEDVVAGQQPLVVDGDDAAAAAHGRALLRKAATPPASHAGMADDDRRSRRGARRRGPRPARTPRRRPRAGGGRAAGSRGSPARADDEVRAVLHGPASTALHEQVGIARDVADGRVELGQRDAHGGDCRVRPGGPGPLDHRERSDARSRHALIRRRSSSAGATWGRHPSGPGSSSAGGCRQRPPRGTRRAPRASRSQSSTSSRSRRTSRISSWRVMVIGSFWSRPDLDADALQHPLGRLHADDDREDVARRTSCRRRAA